MSDERWIPLLRAGKRPRTIRAGSASIRIGKRRLNAMAKNLNAQVLRRAVPLEPEGALVQPVQPVYGWLRAARVTPLPDGGAVLEARLEPTRIGAIALAADAYHYLAPAFYLDYTDKETGAHHGTTLLSVALSSRPLDPSIQCRLDATQTRDEMQV